LGYQRRALTREGQVAYREREQAENLARTNAEAGPEAKVLIHVGYSHAAERPIGQPGQQDEWMAARLGRLVPAIYVAAGMAIRWAVQGDS